MTGYENRFQTVDSAIKKADANVEFWKGRITDSLAHQLSTEVDRSFSFELQVDFIQVMQKYKQKTKELRELENAPGPGFAPVLPSTCTVTTTATNTTTSTPFIPLSSPLPVLRPPSPLDWGLAQQQFYLGPYGMGAAGNNAGGLRASTPSRASLQTPPPPTTTSHK